MPALLNECLKFSDDIIISAFDKLFSNIPESPTELQAFCDVAPDKIKVVVHKFTNDKHPRYFHNFARWESIAHTKHDYIFFLDADEIPEGDIFKYLLENNMLTDYDGIDFRCHWYFRTVRNQAIQKEICGLIIKKSVITNELMFTDLERWSFRQALGSKYLSDVTFEGQILMHHFSWVRSKDEMLQKVDSWGHKFDKDWISLIHEEFSRPFNGTDFVHNYAYNIVEDRFKILR